MTSGVSTILMICFHVLSTGVAEVSLECHQDAAIGVGASAVLKRAAPFVPEDGAMALGANDVGQDLVADGALARDRDGAADMCFSN